MATDQEKALAIARSRRTRAEAESAPSESFTMGAIKDILPPGLKGGAEADRQLGLTGRAAVEGALAIPAMGMDVVAGIVYKALDAAGIEHKDAYMTEGIRRGLTDLGLPEPEGGIEQFSQAVAQGLTGGGSVLKLGQQMAKGAGPVTARIGETLAQQPLAVVGSGGTGAAAAEATRQVGGGPIAQLAAGVVGGAAFPSGVPKAGIGIKPPRAVAVEVAEEALKVKSRATAAQKALTPKAVASQEVVSHLAPIQKVLKLQNTEASRAVVRFLDEIAPRGSIAATAKGRAAAQGTLKALRETQKAVSSPLYRKAFETQKKLVKTTEILKKLNRIAKENDAGTDPNTGKKIASPVQDKVNEFASRVRATRGNLEKLHKTKEWLDAELAKFGDSAIDRNAARVMKTEVKDDFLEMLRKSSDDYDAGYQKFLETQVPIDEARDSLIGVLSDKDNIQLETALTKVFSSDIDEVKALRKALDQQDPEAFAGMYRTHMQKLFEKASSTAVEGAVDTPLAGNVPQEIWNKFFENAKTYNTLLGSAPTESIRKNLKYLRTVMRSYKEGRTTKSLAPERAEVVKELGGVSGAIARFFTAAKFRPVGEAAAKTSEALSRGGLRKRTEALVKALTDPQYEDALSAIRKISPKEARAARMMEQLLLRVEADNSTQEEKTQ